MLKSDVIGREELQEKLVPLVDCFLFWITQLANTFFLNFSEADPPGMESP